MNRKTSLALSAAALLGLLSVVAPVPGAYAQGTTKAAPPVNDTVASVDKMFIMAAAQGNMAEVMTSQLALKKSRNNNVRMIAEMLIKEHSQAQRDLRPVAQSAGVRMPRQPNPEQRAMYRMLSRLNGAAFDRAFMAGQVKSHLATISLFQTEYRTGRDKEATDYAAEYLPAVQNHTSMIVEVAKSVRVPLSHAARQYEKTKSGAGMRMNNGRM
jgi:putative membrane protein